jgi:dihydropteroate synthase
VTAERVRPGPDGYPSGTPDSAERCYVCPRTLLSGADATARVADGGALPLAGTGLAFTHCDVVRRTGTAAPERTTIAAPELRSEPAGALAPTVERLTMPRAPMRLGGATLSFERPLIMAVLNVTPDSFSGDGLAGDVPAAIARARRLIDEGADLIDVGGESTRPGAPPVAAAEECARVVPVISALRDLGVPVSVDTRRAEVMDAAVRAGATMINDVSALLGDPAGAHAAARSGAAVVLNHMRGTPGTMQEDPRYADVLLDVYDDLAQRVDAAVAAGVARERVIVDPGIGFGKTAGHNLRLLRGLAMFHGLGCPVLVGASRKSFIGTLAGGAPAERRLPGSLAALLAAVHHGANIVRVHDVAETRQALAVWGGIFAGG